MNNARSYLSRFSGLILFIVAVLIVLLLIILTINSANEDSADSNGTTTSEVASESESETGQVAPPDSTESTTRSTQSLTIATVDLDSGDSLNINTTTIQGSSNVPSQTSGTENETEIIGGGIVAGAADGNTLPNTGATEIFAASAVISLMTAASISLYKSHRKLSRQLLDI